MALAKYFEDIMERFYEDTSNQEDLRKRLSFIDLQWKQKLKAFDPLYDCLLEWNDKGAKTLEELIETEKKIAQQFQSQSTQTAFSIITFEKLMKILKDIIKELNKYYRNNRTGLETLKYQQVYDNALNEFKNAITKAQDVWLKYRNAYQEIKANTLIRPTPEQLTILQLNDDQQKLVSLDYQGYRRVQGISGSGKTLILVHRAHRLAIENPQKTVRVFTISRELSSEIQYLLKILSPHGKIPHNMIIEAFSEFLFNVIKMFDSEVIKLYKLKQTLKNNTNESIQARNGKSDSWLTFIEHHEHINTLFSDSQVLQLLQYLENYFEKENNINLKISDSVSLYLYQELDYVRSLNGNSSYKEIERSGRAIGFNSDHREAILKILTAWNEWLLKGGLIDSTGLVQEAYKYFSQPNKLETILKSYPTDHILIDEMQDFSVLELTILLKIFTKPLEQKNALFMTGDFNQKISIKDHRSILAGYNFKGRSNNLKKNYRNSRFILQAALKIVNKYPSISQEEEILNSEYELSEYDGKKPRVFSFNDQKTELLEILQFISNHYQKLGSIAVLVPDYDSLTSLEDISKTKINVEFRCLLGNEQFESWQSFQKTNQARYVIGIYEDAKGFEFDTVFLLKLSKNKFPRPNIPKGEIYREAAIFYSAMTRARTNLFITYTIYPSIFIQDMENTIEEESWIPSLKENFYWLERDLKK